MVRELQADQQTQGAMQWWGGAHGGWAAAGDQEPVVGDAHGGHALAWGGQGQVLALLDARPAAPVKRLQVQRERFHLRQQARAVAAYYHQLFAASYRRAPHLRISLFR